MISNEHVGKTIRYWKKGWHSGTLLKIDGSVAIIKHPVHKRDQRVSVKDCDIYQGDVKMTVFERLLAAAQTVGCKEQGPYEPDQEFLTSLVKAISTISNQEWESLPQFAQDWFNTAAGSVSSNQLIAYPQGYVGKTSVEETKKVVEPKKGLTATEVFNNKTVPPLNPFKEKKKSTGYMEAIRKTVIIHPEWTTRQVYDYLKLNGFPNAKIDTIAVDGGNIRRVIEIAKELGYWKGPDVIEAPIEESLIHAAASK